LMTTIGSNRRIPNIAFDHALILRDCANPNG